MTVCGGSPGRRPRRSRSASPPRFRSARLGSKEHNEEVRRKIADKRKAKETKEVEKFDYDRIAALVKEAMGSHTSRLNNLQNAVNGINGLLHNVELAQGEEPAIGTPKTPPNPDRSPTNTDDSISDVSDFED